MSRDRNGTWSRWRLARNSTIVPTGRTIKEHCYIRNRLDDSTTYDGNVCINPFIQIDTGTLFDGLRRIANDATANANHDLD
jgi:hypothetical protein